MYQYYNEQSRVDGSVGLLKNVPAVILNKLNIANKNENGDKMIEFVIISGDTVDNLDNFVDSLGGRFESLGYGYGIVTIPIDKIDALLTNTSIQYVEIPLNLITTDSSSNKSACITQAQNSYGLDGSGVIVGFVDSGIDYTHPAFRNEDGTTRIEYIYDLSNGGVIYSKNDINTAIKSNDPLSIVNVVDTTEHGTHVAGIACAGGKIPREYYGVAPRSSIIMVKAMRGKYVLSTQILRGIKFLIDKSKELKMPLAVNISLSTNEGSHNGSSLLEKYISTVASIEKATIVIAAGNEGDASHHAQGILKETEVLEINVGSDEQSITINFYKPVLPDVSIEIISPLGTSSREIVINQGYYEGGVGVDRYFLYSTGPKPFDILGQIIIGLSTYGSFLTAGTWKIIIRLKNEYSGKYNAWLPIREGLNTNTKFLNPSAYNTLGIPATVNNIISVGSYNYLTGTISPFSGRGIEGEEQYIRPDIVAPGENITSAAPNRSFDSKSGTSMATPHVTGSSALLMQWGIVKGNDYYLFGERLKYYLIKAAKRSRSDISYPSPIWGYGELCLYNTINDLNMVINQSRSDGNYKNEEYDEYNINKLYIRKPIGT